MESMSRLGRFRERLGAVRETRKCKPYVRMVKDDRGLVNVLPERLRGQESEPSFQSPLQGDRSNTLILVKSREKRKRNFAYFSTNSAGKAVRLGKMQNP
jgi:hypothetical protein